MIALNGIQDGLGSAKLPMSGPVFDASAIEMNRRMRVNPLRQHTPESLSSALDQFNLGYLRPAAQLWAAMWERDDTLSFVKPQLEESIAGKPWGVQKVKNADDAEASRHAAALEYCYGNLTAVDAYDRNVRGKLNLFLRQMGAAFSFRYQVHHFVWKPGQTMIQVKDAKPVPAITAELEAVPLWFFENLTGTLRFLPLDGYGYEGQKLNWDGEWMCTTGRGAMFAASISLTFKRLGFQDWTNFNERYAQPKVVGMTNALKDSDPGRAMQNIVSTFNGDMGVTLFEVSDTTKPPIALLGPEGTASVDIFERFLDRQDKKLTVMYRGSAQANIASKDNDTGITAQIEETEALELAHCHNIAGACQHFIDRQVIKFCFGKDVEPLAYFGLPGMDKEDAKQIRESAGFLADRGLLVEADTIAERLNITLTEHPEDALQSAAALGAAADTEPDGKETAANARRRARLTALVEEALVAVNSNPNHDAKGRFASQAAGEVAMRRAINEGVDITDAMTHPDLGSIDFRHGTPGDAATKHKGGHGVSHIVAKHGSEMAMKVPAIIAHGVLKKGAAKVDIEHANHRVTLANNLDGQPTNHWVITAFEKGTGNR